MYVLEREPDRLRQKEFEDHSINLTLLSLQFRVLGREIFNNCGSGHSEADAHGLEAVAAAGALELVKEFRHEDRSSCAQGVTVGHGST